MIPATARETWRDTPTRTINADGVTFAYRQLGARTDVPLIALPHFTAVLDDWDPRVIDGIAARRRVIAFDNRGVGASSGRVPSNVEEMARDAITFIRALDLVQVDLLGFSLGGFVAQVIALEEAALVRRLVLAGTGPAGGGNGTARLAKAAVGAFARSAFTRRHPKHFLFFPHTQHGDSAATDYLARLEERSEDRDKRISPRAALAQLRAVRAFRLGPPHDLSAIHHPTLVANGDDDVMIATSYSGELAERLPNARLRIYPASGHGGVFQHYHQFVPEVLNLLEEPTASSRPGSYCGPTTASSRRANAPAITR